MRVLLCLLLLAQCTARAQQQNWYKMLSGTIGKYPVVMHLHKAGSSYFGYYYYLNSQQPVAFQSRDTSGTQPVRLVVAGVQQDEYFNLKWATDTFTGSWNAGRQSLPFNALAGNGNALFSVIHFAQEQALVPDSAGSPKARYATSVVWPQPHNGHPNRYAVVRNAIRQFINGMPTGAEPQAAIHTAAARYFANYVQENKGATSKELTEMPALFSRDETRRAAVVYQDKALLSLALFAYAYTGGAHGNYGTRYEAFDLINGKTLQLQDIFTPAGIRALPGLLANAYRQQRGLRPNAPLTEGGLFEQKIQPTGNFWISGKAIGFSYMPYEIGPYVLGEIMIPLNFSAIQRYLQPGFWNLVKKN